MRGGNGRPVGRCVRWHRAVHRDDGVRRFVCHLNSNMLRSTDDAEFIAHARRDVPFLLTEVRELREELDHVQADLERYSRAAGGTL